MDRCPLRGCQLASGNKKRAQVYNVFPSPECSLAVSLLCLNETIKAGVYCLQPGLAHELGVLYGMFLVLTA